MESASPGKGQDSRRELLAVAIDCFARFGFQATSIDRIAREAGVTKGALYYHFKDKSELLSEAVKSRVGQWEGRVIGDVRAAGSAADRLRQVIRVCVDHATKSNHRRMIITLMVEALDSNAQLSEDFRAMMQRFRAFVRSVVEVGQKHGEFRSDIDAGVAAEIFSGAVMGAEIQYYQDPAAISLNELLDAFLAQHLSWLTAGVNGRHHPRAVTGTLPARTRKKRS